MVGLSRYSISSMEYTRKCLAILVARKIKNQDVIDLLFQLFILRGIPEHIRSGNGPEFTAKAVRKWLNRLGVKTLFIEPGSPWENGYIESFNGKLRDELLAREIFTTLEEAKVLIEQWRREYNQYDHIARWDIYHQLLRLYWLQLRLNKWYHCWGQVKRRE